MDKKEAGGEGGDYGGEEECEWRADKRYEKTGRQCKRRELGSEERRMLVGRRGGVWRTGEEAG